MFSGIPLRTAKIQVIRDEVSNEPHEVRFLIFFDYENPIGMCVVKVKPNQVAEIYDIRIFEPYRRKHYGSQLWSFAEKYILENYNVKRFIGELNLDSYPASVKFWKSQNFRITYETKNLAFATKSTEH